MQDLLQEPVMIFLNQDIALKNGKLQSQHGEDVLTDFLNRNIGLVDAALDQKLLNKKDR